MNDQFGLSPEQRRKLYEAVQESIREQDEEVRKSINTTAKLEFICCRMGEVL